ncbi:MAG: hypothetical protein HEQ23_01335 [Tepidisphaera sp.]
MHRNLHLILVVSVLAWWGLTESLNFAIAHQHGSPFIPFTERRDTGELTPFRSANITSGEHAMVRALSAGCFLMPLTYALVCTTFAKAFSRFFQALDQPASSLALPLALRHARPHLGWLFACALLLIVCVRIYTLSAWEAAVHIYD